VHEPSWRAVASAAYPSTLGVSVLAVIALVAGKGILAALLGGVVAGLGVASGIGLVTLLAWEHERGARLYLGTDGRRFVDR
jgi:preprotein translocase subunit SecY